MSRLTTAFGPYTLLKVVVVVAAALGEMAVIALVPTFSYLTLAVPAVIALTAIIFIWPFAGLLLMAVSLPFAPQLSFAGIWLTSTYFIMALCLVSVFLKAAVRKEKLRRFPFALPLLSLMAVGAISTLNAAFLGNPVRETIHLLQLLIVLPWLVVNLVKTREQARYLTYALFASGVTVALYSLYQLRTEDSITRVQGFIQNSNAMAVYLAWVVLMLSSFAMYAGSRKPKWLALSLSVLVLFAFVTALSRGATLGLLAGMGVMTSMARKRAGAMILPLLLGIVLAGLAFSGPLATRLEGALTDSVDTRTTAWVTAFRMMEDNPLLGVGLGNYTVQSIFDQYSPVETPSFDQAHNFYLEVGAGYGVFGLLVILWFFVQVLWFELRLFRRSQSALTREVCLGFLGIHVAYMVATLFDLGLVRSYELYTIMMGLTVAVSRMEPSRTVAALDGETRPGVIEASAGIWRMA